MRVVGGLKDKVVSGSGLERLNRAESRLESLEAAATENEQLEALLEPLVSLLEEQVVVLLERDHGVEA